MFVVPTLIVVAGSAGARRAARLILCRRAPYLAAKGCLRAPFPLVAAARYWPRGGSRQNGVRGARRRARGARAARSPPRGQAAARPSSWPARRASARPGSRPSSPAAPARRASGPCSAGRSISSAPSCPTSRSPRPCARLGDRRRPRSADAPAGSQLRVFEETLALLTGHAAAAPVLLVLEDLHWADTSTLDLVVFLAHNLAERPVVLLATYRRDEPSSAGRMRRLADGVRRSGSGLVLELGPLAPGELTALLAARAPLPAAVTDAIVARSEGNPFFAEELLAGLAAGGETGELPRRLRDLLLQRVARLDPATQDLLRLAAAAGRDVGYPLLRALAAVPSPTCASRCARPSSTKSSSPTRPRAPSGSATRCWPKPSTRRSSPASARNCTPGSPRSCRAPRPRHRPSSRRTGRPRAAPREALTASVEAARQAEAVFGLAEAAAHLERALALWPAVPGAAGLDRARPGRALLLGGRTRQPDRRLAARGRARPARHRAHRGRRPGPVRPCCTCASGCTCTRPAATTPGSPRSSARSSSPRRPRRSARRRSRRSAPGCRWPGAPRSHSRSASRRSRSPGRPGRGRPSCGRSPCSAATSPTSAAATRASPGSGRPCGSPGKSAIRWPCSGCTSPSPTC